MRRPRKRQIPTRRHGHAEPDSQAGAHLRGTDSMEGPTVAGPTQPGPPEQGEASRPRFPSPDDRAASITAEGEVGRAAQGHDDHQAPVAPSVQMRGDAYRARRVRHDAGFVDAPGLEPENFLPLAPHLLADGPACPRNEGGSLEKARKRRSLLSAGVPGRSGLGTSGLGPLQPRRSAPPGKALPRRNGRSPLPN